jgi:hypothetical protein
MALLDAVSGMGPITVNAIPGLEAAIGGGRRALPFNPAEQAAELNLLWCAHFFVRVAGPATCGAMQEMFQTPPATLQRLADQMQTGADWWGAPGRGAALAARLAALGAPRRGDDGLAADGRFVLLRNRYEALKALHTLLPAAHEVRARAERARVLEEAIAARPLELTAASSLREELRHSLRAAYAVAMHAIQRAQRAGLEFQAAHLHVDACNALASGALGPTWTAGQMRPLHEAARRLIDASKAAAPAALWAHLDELLRFQARELAAAAGGDDAYCFSTTAVVRVSSERSLVRTCAACPNTRAEMQQCSRCRGAWYCSPACQRAHWPTHKAACKAAAARRGA